MGKEEMEQREFWRGIASLAESIGFFLSADIAFEALRRDDRRDLDHFSGRYLGRKLTPHELLALYRIVTRSTTWRNVKWPATPKYLGRSVWLEGQRIRTAREWDGIRTPEQLERDALAARELGRGRGLSPRPDRVLVRKETAAFRAEVLVRVAARVRRDGSALELKILDLMGNGHLPGEIVSELGIEHWQVQAFERKCGRWGAMEAKNLRRAMSSRRVSAA